MVKCIRDGQSFTNLYDFQQHCKEFHPEIYNRMKVMRTLVQPKHEMDKEHQPIEGSTATGSAEGTSITKPDSEVKWTTSNAN